MGKSLDKTLVNNYIDRYRSLVGEYEQVKKGVHPYFKYAKEFYQSNQLTYKTFLKYYNRFKQSKDRRSLLPQKRGPKYRTRRTIPFIENKVVKLRENGNSRYEIHSLLKPKFKSYTPSPSTIYNISKRYNLNRLNKTMKSNKRKIIKKKAGELGHVDCHYLPKDIIKGEFKKRYLVCVLDDCTRIAHAELVEDIKAVTVAFTVLRCLNIFAQEYSIRFEEILTDNGAEFGGSVLKGENRKYQVFERMLMEMGIKHRFTRPYRPQTNGKVERFWRTLNEDMLEDTEYESSKKLEKELLEYLYYYNNMRPHQGIEEKTPVEFKNLLPN